MVAAIAREFRVLPSEVARDLDEDPRQLSISCFYVLRYAEAKRALDTAKDPKSLEPWKGSKMMSEVKVNTRTLATERRERALRQRAERGQAAPRKVRKA